MSAVQLVSAPNDSAFTAVVSSSSTSLVHVPRSVPDTRSDTALVGDNYMWSVSLGDNGSFNFYALPQQNYRNSAAGQRSGFQQEASAAQRSWQPTPSAMTQYAMYDGIAAATSYGHSIDIYA